MTSARDSYFGWDELTHGDGCRMPVWAVDTRTEYDAYRHRGKDNAPHACPNEDCGHGHRFERTVIRIVCRSCGHAHVVTGETGVGFTSTRRLGYGLPPRRLSGLLLWPGEPFFSFGRLGSDEPWDYVVTGFGVKGRPAEADVVGEISQTRGARGAVRYSASAVPSPDGEYGWGDWRWAAAAEGLRSPSAAAKWIAAHTPSGTESATAGVRS